MKKYLVILHFYNKNEYRKLYCETKEEIKLLKKQLKMDNKELEKQGKNNLLCKITYIAKIEEVLYEER